VRLTDSENYEGDNKFSFDGKQIVFVREEDGSGHIWIMNEDGSHQRQLTTGDQYDHGPSLSADGLKIVFTRRVHDFRFRRGSGGSAEIFIMKSDGTELKRLTNNDHADWEASLSPVGGEILYTVDSQEIWTMHEDGSNCRDLGPGASPSYSRDGKRIVFIAGEYGGREISIMNSDGTGRHRIYYSEIYKSSPSFTADGKAVVFLEEHRGRGVGEICMVSIDGSGRKVITTTK
jgi:Tol biopolymer transport system component